jgi:membrane protein YdbS with pleckstrin-like domain
MRQPAFNVVFGASRAKNKAHAADRIDQGCLARAVHLVPQVTDVHVDKIGGPDLWRRLAVVAVTVSVGSEGAFF